MHLLQLLRPQQWVKNLLIFIPIIFARGLFNLAKLEPAVYAFISFSLIASAGYVFNDLLDKKQDARHPQKQTRPIAAGKISTKEAWAILGVTGVLGVLVALILLPLKFWLVIGVYVGLNTLYSVWLKRIALLDILLISSFYLLRVLAGGVATDTFISEWLVLVMGAGALLLITGKRLGELGRKNQRAVLKSYSPDFLHQILTIAASLTIITYSLYTVLGAYSHLAIYSVIFVIFGVLRYLQIVKESPKKAEYPEKVLLQDKALLLALLGWGIYMLVILYAELASYAIIFAVV